MLEAIIVILGFLGLMIFFLAYDALTWGLVCYKFWYWFLMPVFPTLPQIVFWQAVGLMFFISLFRNPVLGIMKKEYRDDNAQTIATIIVPWIALVVGYFVYTWIIPHINLI